MSAANNPLPGDNEFARWEHEGGWSELIVNGAVVLRTVSMGLSAEALELDKLNAAARELVKDAERAARSVGFADALEKAAKFVENRTEGLYDANWLAAEIRALITSKGEAALPKEGE